MIDQETYSQGDQKIHILGEAEYDGPLSTYVDDWEALFEYALASREGPQPTPSATTGPTSPPDREPTDPATLPADTSGTESERSGTDIRISKQFKRAVFDHYDGTCPLTGIEHNELLTVSHILGRADHPESAEDIENVVLLDWTHHMAFDNGLWTFDETGRIWLRPGFDTASQSLCSSLVERRGEKIQALALVGDQFIEQHNDGLEWWPPQG
nr:HNH endonuclease [Halomarina rubra]